MNMLHKTDKSRVKRTHERGNFDRDVVNSILDAMPLAHVGYTVNGEPLVTPTFQWREGNHVYWHGSSASRALRSAEGTSVCLTVSILDGFVMARSAFHHSANYRSVMLFGEAFKVEDPVEKIGKLNTFVESFFPGRLAMMRPNSTKEMKATTILGMEILEGSAKIRTGGPVDDEEDMDAKVWAGVVPICLSVGEPEPDTGLSTDIPLPDHLKNLQIG